MFHVDLKRVETALAGGRLDDAFEWLCESPSRAHRDGQRLIEKLADAMIARSRQHFEAGRTADARADIDRARQLAGRRTDIAELDRDIAIAESDEQDRLRKHHAAKDQAKRNLQIGRYTLAGKLLDRAPESERVLMSESIDRRRMIAQDAADQLDLAIRNDDLSSAYSIARSIEPEVAAHPAIRQRLSSLVETQCDRILGDVASGRLDRAGQGLNDLIAIDESSQAVGEVNALLKRCRLVQSHLAKARFRDAYRELAILQRALPDSNWVEEARQSVAGIVDQLSSLETGPLAFLDDVAPTRMPTRHRVIENPFANRQDLVRGDQAGERPAEHKRLLLRVDGVGSILVLLADHISIGSTSRSKSIDLPLQTDGAPEPIWIRRSGDDYFAQSDQPFSINDQSTRRKLLSNNDSIQYGRRGRVRFQRRVPASASALLYLSGATLPRRDIRHVALLADSLVFSPHGGHFLLPELESPIIVFRDDQGLWVKYSENQSSVTERLQIDHPVVMAGVRFSLADAITV